MKKTLTLGARPFVVLGIIFVPLLIPVFYQLYRQEWREASGILAIWTLIVAFIISQLHFRKIEVDEEKIVVVGWYGEKARAYFRDVSHTRVCVLFEPDHPASITLFSSSQKPLLEIKPELLKKTDIAWLLSLPAIKVEQKKAPNPESSVSL
jgi:hypothetical protein